MKKAKLVLSSLIVLVSVSGMLAFTNMKTTTFCVRPLSQGAGACTGTITGLKSTGNATHFGYQRLTDCTAACNTQIDIQGE
jgi:hypothetical protein